MYLPVNGFTHCAGEVDGLVGETGHEFFNGAVDDVAFLFVRGVVVERELRQTLLDVRQTRRMDVVCSDARIPVYHSGTRA